MPTCPTCELPTHEDVENDEIELTYKRHGKLLNYTHGWTACPRCLIGAIKCLDEYMEVQRINRGISIRANRKQYENNGKSIFNCTTIIR
jgi:hypothetical protein